MNAQGALDNFGFGLFITGYIRKPALVYHRVGAFTLPRDFAQQGHGDLRAKTRPQAQGIFDAVAAAFRQVQIAQLGVGLKSIVDVGNRRYRAVLQGFDRQHVFNSNPHGVPGIAFGVGNHHLVGLLAESAPQGVNFGRCAAAAGRGIRFVRDEHRFGSHLLAAHAEALFG